MIIGRKKFSGESEEDSRIDAPTWGDGLGGHPIHTPPTAFCFPIFP